MLTERWYAWENARVAAMEDEEIDLYADPEQGGQAYLPVDRQAQVRLPDSEDCFEWLLTVLRSISRHSKV